MFSKVIFNQNSKLRLSYFAERYPKFLIGWPKKIQKITEWLGNIVLLLLKEVLIPFANWATLDASEALNLSSICWKAARATNWSNCCCCWRHCCEGIGTIFVGIEEGICVCNWGRNKWFCKMLEVEEDDGEKGIPPSIIEEEANDGLANEGSKIRRGVMEGGTWRITNCWGG